MLKTSVSRVVLVIPCFKEARRLPLFLPDLMEALEKVDCSVQVVDDGSPLDDVAVISGLVEKLCVRFPAKLAPLLKLAANQGKGAAVRAGWQAHPDIQQLAFVDADGSISPSEVRRVLEMALDAPQDAYFASRLKMPGHEVDRRFFRHYWGRVFAALVSFRLQVDIYDTQCGLKIIPRAVFKTKNARFEENGFAFDLELLVALREQRICIREIPIDWKHVSGSKIHLIRDSIAMCRSLHRIARRQSK